MPPLDDPIRGKSLYAHNGNALSLLVTLESLRKQLQILPITASTYPEEVAHLQQALAELIRHTEVYSGKKKGKKRAEGGDGEGRTADWLDSEGQMMSTLSLSICWILK